MNWQNGVSKEARDSMELIGSFGPVTRTDDRTVKGWVYDSEVEGNITDLYLSSTDLREMAVHFVEVADWLDSRASASIEVPPLTTMI